jgi:hypothetical protein
MRMIGHNVRETDVSPKLARTDDDCIPRVIQERELHPIQSNSCVPSISSCSSDCQD